MDRFHKACLVCIIVLLLVIAIRPGIRLQTAQAAQSARTYPQYIYFMADPMPSRHAPPEAAKRYWFTVEQKLTDAARAGYDVVSVTSVNDSNLFFLFARRGGGASAQGL